MWLAQNQASSSWMTFMPFVLMIVVFYFLLIRPQQKRQKQRGIMLNSLSKDDQVTTIGGLHGTIKEITDSTVRLQVADDTVLTVELSSIGGVKQRSDANS